MKFKTLNFFPYYHRRICNMNQVWMPSILQLIFQLFLTQKVRNESRTENVQLKKGLRLESMVTSMVLLLLQKKKNWIKEPTSLESTVREFCVMLEKVQKRKSSHYVKSKYFTKRASGFVGEYRPNCPEVLIGSLRWFDNFIYCGIRC